MCDAEVRFDLCIRPKQDNDKYGTFVVMTI